MEPQELDRILRTELNEIYKYEEKQKRFLKDLTLFQMPYYNMLLLRAQEPKAEFVRPFKTYYKMNAILHDDYFDHQIVLFNDPRADVLYDPIQPMVGAQHDKNFMDPAKLETKIVYDVSVTDGSYIKSPKRNWFKYWQSDMQSSYELLCDYFHQERDLSEKELDEKVLDVVKVVLINEINNKRLSPEEKEYLLESVLYIISITLGFENKQLTLSSFKKLPSSDNPFFLQRKYAANTEHLYHKITKQISAFRRKLAQDKNELSEEAEF